MKRKLPASSFLPFLLLICIDFCLPLRGKGAKDNKSIDSLQHFLETSPEDTGKVNLLNALFSTISYKSPEKALPMAEQALKLAVKLSYKQGQAKALENIGLFYSLNNNGKNAIDYNLQALQIYEKARDNKEIVNTIIAIADIYKKQLNYDKAMEFYLKALRRSEDLILDSETTVMPDNKIVVQKQQARILYSIGKIYKSQNNYKESLKYFSKALDIYASIGDEKGLADVSLSMGIVYYDSSNKDKSQTFIYKGDHKEAMEYVTKARKLYEKLNNENGIINADNHLAYISAGQGEYGLGVQYALEGLKIAQKIQNKEMEASLNGTLGDIYHAQGNYKKALEYLYKCYEGAKAVDNKYYIRDLYLSFASIYAKLNDYKKAYENYKLYSDMKDELLSEQSNRQIAEINAQYDSERKDKELIKKDAELAKQQAETRQQNSQRNALIISFLSVLFISFFIYRGYRNNKKAKVSITKQKEEIERSYKNIAILSEIEQEITSAHTIETIIEKVYENVNKLMSADVFCIGIHNENKNSIDFPGFLEKGKKYNSSYNLNDNVRFPVLCFKNRLEIFINDLAKEYSRYIPYIPDPIAGEQPESLIYLPLIYKDKTIGVITVESFSKNAYTHYHLDILKNLAVYVAIALENAQRTQEVIKQKEQLEISYNDIHVLSEIGQQITSTLDFEEIFNKLHESISHLMDAECFGVRIYHPETETVEVKYEYDKGERIKPLSFSMDNDNNYSVWCIKNKKEIFINDNTTEYKNYVNDIVVINGEMTYSLMFCPMFLKDEIIGVITVQSYQKNKYTKHHLDILRTLANYTAIALENAQLYENLEEKVKDRTAEVLKQKEEVEKSYQNTRLLSDIGREISSILSVEEIITTVYENVNKLMDASVFGIGIINQAGTRLDCSGFIEKGEKLPFFYIAIAEEVRPAVWCFKNQQEIVINDLKKEYNRYFPESKIPEPKEGEQAESIIYLPLSLQGKRIGVITVQSFKQNAYTQYELDILRNLAVYTVNALENARLYENMEDEVKARTLEIEKQKDELARLSLVASETDNGVLIFDAKGEIEWINEGFTRLQGYTFEELKQEKNTIQKMSYNPEIAALIERSIKNKKSSVYQALNVTKDGKELWIQSSLTPILNENGEIKNWVVIDVDITNLKKAEDSIRLQNEKITDSINYAQKIQETLLPPLEEIKKYLPSSFLLYKPKDIVSGDFYWIHKDQKRILIAVADCTGHGVPGAFMSLMGNNLLNDIVKVRGKYTPSEILDELNIQILTTLNQNSKTTSVKYGMDISLVCLEPEEWGHDASPGFLMQYAGAHSPLLIFRENECIQIKANKRPVGSYKKEEEPGFTNNLFHLIKGDMIYMFSDGYADQIGGPENKKMFAQPFRDILQSLALLEISKQKEILENTLNRWQGKQNQTDDILVLGIRI